MELTPLQLNYVVDRCVDLDADDARRGMFIVALQSALQDMPDDCQGVHLHFERSGPCNGIVFLNGIQLKKVFKLEQHIGVNEARSVTVQFAVNRITGFDTP